MNGHAEHRMEDAKRARFPDPMCLCPAKKSH